MDTAFLVPAKEVGGVGQSLGRTIPRFADGSMRTILRRLARAAIAPLSPSEEGIRVLFKRAGLLLLVSNIHDEVRGETTVYGPRIRHASRTNPDSNFLGAMAYNWCMAIGLIAVGGFGVVLLRRFDRFDPFSPDFPWPDDENSKPGES